MLESTLFTVPVDVLYLRAVLNIYFYFGYFCYLYTVDHFRSKRGVFCETCSTVCHDLPNVANTTLRRRLWSNVDPTLLWCIVFSGYFVFFINGLSEFKYSIMYCRPTIGFKYFAVAFPYL